MGSWSVDRFKRLGGVAMVVAGLTVAAMAQGGGGGRPAKGIPIVESAKEIIDHSSRLYSNLVRGYGKATIVTEEREERKGLARESKEVLTASLWLWERDRSRVEVSSWEMDVVRVEDGRLRWLYLPGEKIYSRYEADIDGRQAWPGGREGRVNNLADQAAAGMNPHRRLLLGGTVSQPPKLMGEETLEVGGQRVVCHLVQQVKLNARQGVELVEEFWIEKSRHFVWRMVSRVKRAGTRGEVKTETTTISFSELSLNQPLDPEVVAFCPPAEARMVARLEASPERSGGRSGVVTGSEAPDFTLTDLEGRPVRLGALRGKAVLLNFWATWCGPCRVEMPHLEKLYHEYKNKDVAFLTISGEEPETIREFLQRNKYSFGSLVDDTGRVSSTYGVSGIPQTLLIGRGGQVVENLVGSRQERDFRLAIEKALRSNEVPGREGERKAGGESREKACAPRLTRPVVGATLANRVDDQAVNWQFAWTGCAETTRYHLQIWAPGQMSPFFDYAGLLSLRYNFPLNQPIGQKSGAARGLRGWRWRVRGEVEGRWSDWSESHFDVASLVPQAPGLLAPVLVSPADRSVFHIFPRRTVFTWQPVSGAAGYRVEVDVSGEGVWASEYHNRAGKVIETTETTTTHDFVGAQPGRWRVWAVDAEGRPGPKSGWRIFEYTR